MNMFKRFKIEKHRFSKEIHAELTLLNKLDNWHAFIGLAEDYLVIALAIALSLYNPYFYPLTLIIIGARQGALANLAHEAGHGRLTKSKTLNYFIGTYLTGYLIFQEMSTFIDSHVKSHHIYLGDKEKDPDYCYHLQVGLYAHKGCRQFIKDYILKPLYLASIFHYMANIFTNRAPTFKKYKLRATVMTLYLLSIILLVSALGYFKYFLIFWVVPFFTVFPTIGWFVDFVEHYPLVGENRLDIHMTRNRFSHFIEHFIFNMHNENYHLVHHLRPDIPFWNLNKAHQILLKDVEYSKVNQNSGGIFVSSNSRPAFIQSMISRQKNIEKLATTTDH